MERSEPRTIELKEHPGPFEELVRGLRDFEIRANDREYRFGYRLVIREWLPTTQAYSGRAVVRFVKLVVNAKSYGGMFEGAIAPDFVVLGLREKLAPSQALELPAVRR